MELTSVQVETVRSLFLPLQETLIMPIGDLQLDPKVKGKERTADFERFKRHIEWGLEHGAYFIGMGDYVDVMSPSNREKYLGAGFYDSVQDAMTAQAEQTEGELQEVLEPTKGRWLGLLEGHHFFPYEDGSTTDTRLAAFLGTQFLGTSAMVQVKFEASGKHKPPAFTIWAHHGRGAGSALTGPINQLTKITQTFDADVYLIGHHHIKEAVKMPYVHADFPERGGRPRLVHKNRILACTGSFLRGYLQGSQRGGRPNGGYVEKGMMNPVALGGVALWARPRYDHEGYAEVDLDVSL